MGKIVRRGIDFSGGGGSISNPTAASVTFDNTDTGLEATNVQDAVTEVNGKFSNPTASSVTFDNTNTGLNATNVQDAVTEVNDKFSNPTASSVTFNNTDTGLNATNVQDAVKELNGNLDNKLSFTILNSGGNLSAAASREFSISNTKDIIFLFVNYNGNYYTAPCVLNTTGRFTNGIFTINYVFNSITKIITLTADVNCVLVGIYGLV